MFLSSGDVVVTCNLETLVLTVKGDQESDNVVKLAMAFRTCLSAGVQQNGSNTRSFQFEVDNITAEGQ